MPQPERYVISATLVTCSPLAIHCGWGSEDLQAMGLLPQDPPFRPPSDWNKKKLDSCDQLVIRDGAGRPYIPGSSLKGVIRDYLTRDSSTMEPDPVQWLLGEASPRSSETDGDEQGRGGAGVFEDAFLDTRGQCVQHRQAFFHEQHRQWFAQITGTRDLSKSAADYGVAGLQAGDCFAAGSWRIEHDPVALLTCTAHLPYWDPARLTYVEHHIAVDRRTGAVGQHKLFTTEAVPAGIPFGVQLIADHDAERARPAVRLLLRALAGFNLDPVYEPICLGSGTQHGWGRMVCLFSSVGVQVWTPGRVRDVTLEEINVQAELAAGLAEPPMPGRPRVQIDLHLDFQSPLLVNDPAAVCVLQAVKEGIVKSGKDAARDSGDESEDDSKPGIPDHVPRVAGAAIDASDDNNKNLVLRPMVPATGVKGPIRAQLERILRTLHPEIAVSPHGDLYPVCDDSPQFVKELFGYQSHESGLWCSEFVGREPTDGDGNGWSHREMVAIDRFTGGASEHAKFDAIVLDHPTVCGALAVDLPTDWNETQKTLGALALMLRDLIEGDIAFGMGDMKYFGQCVAEIRSIRVAGLGRCLDSLQLPIETGEDEDVNEKVNQWLENVCKAVREYRHRDPRPDSCQKIIEQADTLLDQFLSAVREPVAQVAKEQQHA